MHSAVVEGGSFIFVPFPRCESRSHVADAQDGQFTDLSLVYKLLDGLMVPGITEIQVDGRETSGFFSDVHYFPFFVDSV